MYAGMGYGSLPKNGYRDQVRKRLVLAGLVADRNAAEQCALHKVQNRWEAEMEEIFCIIRCFMHGCNSLQGDKFKPAPGFEVWKEALDQCEAVSTFTRNNFKIKGLLMLAQKDISRFQPKKGQRAKLPLKSQVTRFRSLYRMATRFIQLGDVLNYVYTSSSGRKAEKAVATDQREKVAQFRKWFKDDNLVARVCEAQKGLLATHRALRFGDASAMGSVVQVLSYWKEMEA
jgi:hypothetical protein